MGCFFPCRYSDTGKFFQFSKVYSLRAIIVLLNYEDLEGGVSSRPFYSDILGYLIIASLLMMGACSGGPDKGIKSEVITVNFKQNGWSKIEADLADFAFKHKASKSTLLVNSLCRKYDRTTLEQLTDNILAGLQHVEVTRQEPRTLFKRASLRSEARGKLDGVSTTILIEVVKRDRCIYDFVLITESTSISSKMRSDFDKLLSSIRLEQL